MGCQELETNSCHLPSSNSSPIGAENRKAFTLAEVLITLVIIGIIAAITVPMIHANYQKQATVSKLKKAYANLCNAIKLSELENGPLKEWELPNISYTSGGHDEFFEKYLYPYMKTNKFNPNEPNKWGRKNIDGKDMSSSSFKYSWYKLMDGTSLDFYSQLSTGYFWIYIDLNASAGPNRLGRDIFKFNIYKKDKPELWGQGYTESQLKNGYSIYACKKGTGQIYAGAYCGAWIFNNGWEMPKDYPW